MYIDDYEAILERAEAAERDRDKARRERDEFCEKIRNDIIKIGFIWR